MIPDFIYLLKYDCDIDESSAAFAKELHQLCGGKPLMRSCLGTSKIGIALNGNRIRRCCC